MDANGLKVTKPGATLVVQIDGLQANPVKAGAFANTFAEGQFVRTESRSEKMRPLWHCHPAKETRGAPGRRGCEGVSAEHGIRPR